MTPFLFPFYLNSASNNAKVLPGVSSIWVEMVFISHSPMITMRHISVRPAALRDKDLDSYHYFLRFPCTNNKTRVSSTIPGTKTSVRSTMPEPQETPFMTTMNTPFKNHYIPGNKATSEDPAPA